MISLLLGKLLNAHEVVEYCPLCKTTHTLIALNRADNGKPFRLCPSTLNSFDVNNSNREDKQ